MSVLGQFEPKQAMMYFEELCKIPHGSRNTKQISDYCVNFANERGLSVIQDDLNNIIITKEATPGYEEVGTVILQGHLDMVCEKVEGSDFDFETDGLILETDGVWVWARDTSLGGDDGIAVAMALAILDSKDIPHPRLEAVFTVDEEIGLLGAKDMDLSSLQGKKLINIDCEDDTQVLTSCAGGTFIEGNIPVSFEEVSGIGYTIAVKGLLGGHSGAEIHKGRGNANLLMGRVLYAVRSLIEVSDVHGGNADNVIPSFTAASILVDEKNEAQMLKQLAEVEVEIKNEYVLSDPDVYVAVTKGAVETSRVLVPSSKVILLNALMNLPNGIYAMSAAIPGLVETSTNMGIFAMKNDSLVMNYNVRSSVETAKRHLADRTIAMIEMMGGSISEAGDYPGWQYRIDSPLREMVVKVYTKTLGKEPIVGAVHAGLECGIFASKIEDLDCVSIGPNLNDIHSTNEKMEIASAERIWKLLLGILAEK
ncbi:MAG: aminoacyl-histidine dipeptidase [Eubacteriales bacterium]